MKILIISDPLESFKTYKDTTFAIIRELHQQQIELFHCLSQDLLIANQKVQAYATPFTFIEEQYDYSVTTWFNQGESSHHYLLTEFDAVIMRTDPPFDLQYLYATQLLSLAEKQGVRVFNSAQAMRDYNEKLAIFNFPEFIAPTLVSTYAKEIKAFLEQYQDIIIKPLDGMGGMGIFRLQENDANTNSILEMLMNLDTRTIMAQQYIPEIKQGDKRILIINGQVIDYALARIPQGKDLRGNMAAGGKGIAQELTARDKEIAESIAPTLKKSGIFLAGLDIIGDYLTEVNVTSPTGFQEISKQKNYNVAKIFVDELLQAL